jgi:membrane protease YdiL (CAAX protease family)
MDFTISKPTHLLALLGVLGSFLLFIILPVISLFLPSTIPSVYTASMTPVQQQLLQISLLFFQLFFVFLGMIFVPFLWYRLVNNLSIKDMFARINLRFQRLDLAVLWGLIALITAFAFTMIIGLLVTFSTGVNVEKLSNIPDLLKLFSVPALYLLVIVQPFCEEVFFRGFLLEKITVLSNAPIAILTTALLFGISHLSYTYAYTAYVAVLLGVIFALVVIKTRNLFSSIVAHTILNITSLTLYFFGKSLGF